MWLRADEKQDVDLVVKDQQICVWRLFDLVEGSEFEKLKYIIKFYPEQTQNVELIVFDYDPAKNTSVILASLEKSSLNFQDLQAAQGDKPFILNWWKFKHNNVFIMARKINPKSETFSLAFTFQYRLKPGLSKGAIGALSFFGGLLFIGLVIFVLYSLHIRGIIEVRIPKPLRFWCFKNYLSPEEKAEIAKAEAAKRKIEQQRELNRRLGMKPLE